VNYIRRMTLPTHQVDQIFRKGIVQTVSRRRRGKTHEVSRTHLKGCVSDIRDTMAGYDEYEFLIVVMVVKLGTISPALEAYQMHADSFQSDLDTQRSGETHGIVIELVLATNFLEFVDVAGV